MTSNGNDMETPVVNVAALEPLFAPWDIPNQHRARKNKGQPPEIVMHRRGSPSKLVNSLRVYVNTWRELNYFGASDTTRRLLTYWFEESHHVTTLSGEESEFRYYFCQREAIETFIYLMEVRRLRSLSDLIAECGGETAKIEALGVDPVYNEWARYAFKIATGAGKTKCMSLAIAWSYFHAVRERNSDMARHFLIIAPNLTVFERLKEDFSPSGTEKNIFTRDPIIPPEWRSDWDFSVVLQDGTGGVGKKGALYLSNIHRLYERSKRRRHEVETVDWAGPSVSRSSITDRGEELRKRIISHKRVMVLNDEAHHVWDPDSAWSEAIRWLHVELSKHNDIGIVAQLDFSATPKDNEGKAFSHIICDTPLGEAVDSGIIKTPIIGRTKQLIEQRHDDASYRYEEHLRVGYERWLRSCREWKKSGHKPLLFVMCEDTRAADQIAQRLNNDLDFKELNNKTVNLHTNLKGKIKKKNVGGKRISVFEESEKDISDDDMQEIRRISRELDDNQSPYSCIVSVLMLREGWDVKNVTTIVPLRAYSSGANILPEQTLGRGLRRMLPPGQANELVTVVEHPAFSDLYEQELEQEGVVIDTVETDDVPTSTVSIYPDLQKDCVALDIVLPVLTRAYSIRPQLEGLTIANVQEEFDRLYKPLPLGDVSSVRVEYEGRHLITDEVVERMSVNLPLLQNGITAISFYVQELEMMCRIQNAHSVLAPIIKKFLEEILFDEKTLLTDSRLTNRLADHDVREHIQAVFVPLIRARTVKIKRRDPKGEPVSLCNWKPYQVTRSDRHHAIPAKSTMFNLVPCNQSLELAMAHFLDDASDVIAFAKNAGPQALRIDYLNVDQKIAFYAPDFFVRMDDNSYVLVETKGRQDSDVPRKAAAAVAWCKAVSDDSIKWRYVFVKQDVIDGRSDNRFSKLIRACEPTLSKLLAAVDSFPDLAIRIQQSDSSIESLLTKNILSKLSKFDEKIAREALGIYEFLSNKKGGANFSPAFTVLLRPLEMASKETIFKLLKNKIPINREEQDIWFNPCLKGIDRSSQDHYKLMVKNLKRGFLHDGFQSVIGLLRFCFDCAQNQDLKLEGIFLALRESFSWEGSTQISKHIAVVDNFRNDYVVHAENELTDAAFAKRELKHWIEALVLLRA